MRITIKIDAELLADAQRVTGCRTKDEMVARALKEIVWRDLARQLDEIRGPDPLWPDYDHSAMRIAD